MIFFSNLKKITSPANEFLLYECRNEKIYLYFFSKLKKITSPANEFLLHKCINNRKMKNVFFFSNLKKFTSPANEFLLHKCRNKRYIFFLNLKKLQVQLMSFCYMNVETINKTIYIFFIKSAKITSPANEFLLHKCRNERKMKK